MLRETNCDSKVSFQNTEKIQKYNYYAYEKHGHVEGNNADILEKYSEYVYKYTQKVFEKPVVNAHFQHSEKISDTRKMFDSC